jgi:hypothetical protein
MFSNLNINSMRVYVTSMSSGRHDEQFNDVAYAGTDYNAAYAAAQVYNFPSEWQTFGYIQTWEDGKRIDDELVRE